MKTEQRVSSIALTIHGAKVSHYRMPCSPFCSIQPNCKKKCSSMWDCPKPGLGSLLNTCAHCCSDSNSRRIAILISIWALHRPSEGRCWFLSHEEEKLHRGTCCLWWRLCWIYLHIISALAKTEWALLGSILAPLKGKLFYSSGVSCFSSAGGTERSQPQQSVTI